MSTHKIPRLIATLIPIFSLVSIFKPQIIFHGNIANTRSMAAEYAPAKMLKLTNTSELTQFVWPGDVHVVHVKTATMAIMELMVAMTNQMTYRGQPMVMRSSVRANESLLNMTPIMANVPAKLLARPILGKSSGLINIICLPKPFPILMAEQMVSPRRRTY